MQDCTDESIESLHNRQYPREDRTDPTLHLANSTRVCCGALLVTIEIIDFRGQYGL